MQPYPYNSPIILNDSVFTQYGGQTGTSTATQRQAAYLLAEEQMTEHLSAFLAPTIITGSAWYRGGTLFETEFGYVSQVFLVSALEAKQLSPLQTEVHTGSALIRKSEQGYLDILFPCEPMWIYSTTVVYESGLPTGTSIHPSMLSALTIAAQINLNEWVPDLTNEGVADIGVQSFSNQSYSEQRTKLGHNAFGNSAMAQRAAKLVKKYQVKSGVGFRK